MNNSFKESVKETVKFMTLRSRLDDNCVLGYELNKKTELTEEQISEIIDKIIDEKTFTK